MVFARVVADNECIDATPGDVTAANILARLAAAKMRAMMNLGIFQAERMTERDV